MELLQQLVAEDDLQDATDELQEGHVTVHQAGRQWVVRESNQAAHSLSEHVREHLLEDEESQRVDKGSGAWVPVAPWEDSSSLLLRKISR